MVIFYNWANNYNIYVILNNNDMLDVVMNVRFPYRPNSGYVYISV